MKTDHLQIRKPGTLRMGLMPIFLTIGVLGLGGCASLPGGGARSLEDEILEIISSPPLDQVHWGILIVDPSRNQTLFSLDAHKKFVPASNMKVLSTSTALSLLGPEYRFETEIWGVGELDPSTGHLEGDLVLRPVGDPTLSDRFYPTATAPLDSLAERLWTAGIRSVSGSLVVDASAWDSTTVPGSWMVGNLTGTSGATGAALAIGEGELHVEVRGGPRPGDSATVRWWPETPTDFFSATFLTTQPDSSRRWESSYLPESRQLAIQGVVPAGVTDTISFSQRNPEDLAANALFMAIGRRGIRVGQGIRVSHERNEPLGSGGCVTGWPLEGETTRQDILPDCTGSRPLAALESPSLGEIVEGILEPSQNWMTEQLVRALGLALGEEGSWREGFRVEEEFLSGVVGVDTLDLHFRDGSGLSAYNLVTPRAMVRILTYMRNSPHGDLYRLALAEPGEDPGTLRNRLLGLEGRVFAKTGTISHVNSLSGYLRTESGRDLVFSILTNGSGLSSAPVRAAIDRVVQSVARR